MLSAGWDHEPLRRPDMPSFGSFLQEELLDVNNGKDTDAEVEERAQTFSTKVSNFPERKRSLVRVPSSEDLTHILKEISELEAIDTQRQI